jgi:preprotein translocase subunit SecA
MFQSMKERIEDTVIRNLYRVEPANPDQIADQRQARARQAESSARLSRSGPAQLRPNRTAPPATVQRKGDKVGRNDPCPCGSGKKYKKCCGATVAAG